MADQHAALIDRMSLADKFSVGDRTWPILVGRPAPHSQRPASIERPVSAEVRNRLLEQAFDRLDLGVVLLDASGRSFYRNARAARYLAENDGLGLDCDGRPRATTLVGHHLLTEAIRTAGRRLHGLDAAEDEIVSVPRRSTGRPWSVRVAPLPLGAIASDDAGAVGLFIREPAESSKCDAAQFARLFGLTEAEARVMAHLLLGQSVGAAAAAIGVSPNTVKTQLRSIFRKTGTTKQSGLLRLALSGL